MNRYLVIGCGGFLGAIARYAVGGWVMERWAPRLPAGSAFPYGTLAINLSGSFVLGLFMTVVADRFTISPNWRFFFPIGFVGAYTTFSTYEFETLALMQRGSFILAGANVVGSALAGLLAVWLGSVAARLL